MPDLQNFSITNLSATNVNMPRFRIECQVCDSQTGEVLVDLTGASAIVFPHDMPALFTTTEERREFVRDLAHVLVRKKAGLE